MIPEPIEEKLKSYLELEENWDSYGASKFDKETIENTKILLGKIPHWLLPFLGVYPTPYGTVILNWAKERHLFIEIEIGLTTLAYFYEYPIGFFVETTENIDLTDTSYFDVIVLFLNKLYNK